MDQTNLAILQILQEKARIPNVEVSRMVNLAPSAVLERIRKLEHQGIIEGYEVRLNADHFGCRQLAFIEVYLEPGSDLESLEKQLSSLERVQEVHFLSGRDCYLLKVRIADTAALSQLIRESILPLSGVRKTCSMPVLTTRKETSRIPINPK